MTWDLYCTWHRASRLLWDVLTYSHICLHTSGWSISSLKVYCKNLFEIKYEELSIKVPGLLWVSKKCFLPLPYCPILPSQDFCFLGTVSRVPTELPWLPRFCLNRREETGITGWAAITVRSENKEHYSKITLTVNHNSSHSLCPFNVPGIMLTTLSGLVWWIHKSPAKDTC